MPNKYFTNIIDLITGNRARATDVETNFAQVEAGFDSVAVDIPAAQAAAIATAASNAATAIAAAQLSSALTTVPLDAGKYAKSNGTSVSFQTLPPQNKAGASQALSANLTLTSASPKVLKLVPTGPGFFISLQDATTMLLDVDAQTLANAGAFDIAVRDVSGNLKTVIQPGGIAHFDLVDSSSAAGVWQVSGNNLSPLFWLAANVSISGGSSHSPAGTIKLNNSLVAFITTSGSSIFATIYDMAAQSLGPTTLLTSTGGFSVLNTAMLTATTGIVFGNNGAVAFSVTGVTPTPNNTVTYSACEYGMISSPTQAVVFQASGSSNYIYAISITGTALAIGSQITLAALGSGSAHITPSCPPVVRSATQIVGVTTDTAGGTLGKAFHVTLAGTTATVNSTANCTVIANVASGNPTTNMVPMITDEWWTVMQGTSLTLQRITVTGTTVAVTAGTASPAGAASPIAGNQNAPVALKLNSTTLMAMLQSTNGSPQTQDWYAITASTFVKATSGVFAAPNGGGSALFRAVSTNTGLACTHEIDVGSSVYGGYSLNYWDETFPSGQTSKKSMVALGNSPIGAVDSFVATFGTKDYVFLSSTNSAYVFMVDKAGGATPYIQLAVPPISYVNVSAPNFAQSSNKLAFMGSAGKFNCCEVAQ